MQEYLGMIARSKAGRDRGGRFAVTAAFDDAHVLIADGAKHKVASPKKKKLMHLAFENGRIDDIERILSLPGGTADAALRKALKQDHEN